MEKLNKQVPLYCKSCISWIIVDHLEQLNPSSQGIEQDSIKSLARDVLCPETFTHN
jgi:hypothetical protein